MVPNSQLSLIYVSTEVLLVSKEKVYHLISMKIFIGQSITDLFPLRKEAYLKIVKNTNTTTADQK
jgi:hypothetical protein